MAQDLLVVLGKGKTELGDGTRRATVRKSLGGHGPQIKTTPRGSGIAARAMPGRQPELRGILCSGRPLLPSASCVCLLANNSEIGSLQISPAAFRTCVIMIIDGSHNGRGDSRTVNTVALMQGRPPDKAADRHACFPFHFTINYVSSRFKYSVISSIYVLVVVQHVYREYKAGEGGGHIASE